MKKLTTDQWIERAKNKHGKLYGYDKVQYKGTRIPVTITCNTHGDFEQTPQIHLLSSIGCPLCAKDKPVHNKLTTQKFIESAKQIHEDKYDYSLCHYQSAHGYVKITCPTHGVFEQRANDHTNNKAGCWQCSDTFPHSTDSFIQQLSTRFPKDDCSFELLEYCNMHTPVTISCNIHGDFQVTPHAAYSRRPHLCSLCNSEIHQKTSIGEQQIGDMLELDLSQSVIRNTRLVIAPFELDIYVPQHKLAIEYCGLYWHSEQQGRDRKYHKQKYDMCNAQGIQLLTIFEDEWIGCNNQVRAKIAHLVNKTPPEQKIYARHCTIQQISSKTKAQFLNQYHVQKTGHGSISYGCYHIGQLVAVICCIDHGNGVFCVNRYASSGFVVGGFSKLIKHFQRHHKWTKLTTFADLRWSTGDLYVRAGWTVDTIIPPDYYYSVDGKRRYHKSNFRRRNLANMLDTYDPSKSERVNCDNNSVMRIWDCGKIKYTYNNKVTRT